jgi:K(+)-stimulated pyrophosphate-energized sodium pump
VAAAARDAGRDEGMRIAFRTGGTVGMFTVGLGLLGASSSCSSTAATPRPVLEGFGFGAALLAMFMRVGGGIFTKAATSARTSSARSSRASRGRPAQRRDDRDNVGDNVGDCAGMAADLFESYAVTLVAALILGKAAFGEQGLVFPLIVPAIGAGDRRDRVFITRARAGQSGSGGHQPRASTSPP